jgi:iron complex transport system ATP-binding protein
VSHLNIDHLTFSYPNREVLREVSLEFKPGELIVLLGANGSGKTSLLKCIAKQLKPTHGKVFLDSSDLHVLDRLSLAKHVALMPQFEQRDAPMLVQDVVALGRSPHLGWLTPLGASDYAIVEQAMQMTGTWELKDRNVQELSGGEWRRMILARSIAQDASVLLLDEPTAGLDLKYQYECLERVRTIVKDKNLIGVVTMHDLNQAALFADRIALLASHQVLGFGTASEILKESMIECAFGVKVSILKHPSRDIPLIVPIAAKE